ncbi:MAG: hypothetical protein GWM98_20095, partial [Nitrospinaceae bacterium]|nr:hypothetical protein [Nitrospinaceae bacterium]
ETPASEEFGETVEKAIRFLVEAQEDSGHFKYRDGHDYTHPIAAYALSEAFAMTRVPMVKYAAEKALALVVKGQHKSGGWNYNLNQDDRDDTSYMGWCVQAVKAGSLAGLEVEGLEEVKKRAILGMKKNYGTGAKSNMGGFGYTSPNAKHGLTGVGVLCMQLLGAGNAKEVQGGLRTLQGSQCIWGEKGFHNDNYFWYYITQAKFHTGGDTWVKWNKTFSPVLVKNQTVIPKDQSGYVDHKGEPQQIGWWEMPEENAHHTAGPVMDTTLAALQLQVYYRYLPTFKTPKVDDLAKAGFEADD